jgi:hypothetical protein
MRAPQNRKRLSRRDQDHDAELEPGQVGGNEMAIQRLVAAIINLIAVLLRKWF